MKELAQATLAVLCVAALLCFAGAEVRAHKPLPMVLAGAPPVRANVRYCQFLWQSEVCPIAVYRLEDFPNGGSK